MRREIVHFRRWDVRTQTEAEFVAVYEVTWMPERQLWRWFLLPGKLELVAR